MRRAVLLLGLAACVPTPSADGPVDDRLAGQSSLELSCADGGIELSWSVAAEPLVASYEVRVTGEGAEGAFDVGHDGSGSATLPDALAAACAPCEATLVAIDGEGVAGEVLVTASLDADEDGDGAVGLTCGGGDCDDADAEVYPAAAEVCDGVDNNCSGLADDLEGAPPADRQEGVCAGALQRCDGNGGWLEPDYTKIPGYEATETLCDGLDNNCDGSADNGLTIPDAALTAGVCAGQVQWCDGANGWQEPDYAQISGYEATEATCDGLDNDCDGSEDNGLTAPAAAEQQGVCAGATQVCDGSNGWIEPDYTQIADYEADEVSCDGLDNDCDNEIDTDIATVPSATEQRGVCAGATQVCDGSNGWIEPDAAALAAQFTDYEATEVSCDGLDNDCDGLEDNDLPDELASNQSGVCAGALKVCDGSNGWVDPDYTQIANYEATETSCDTFDNDCSGDADTVYVLDPSAGSLECWGDYDHSRPRLCAEGPFTQVAGNQQTNGSPGFGCVIASDGSLQCFGDNNSGKLGDANPDLWERRWLAPIAEAGTYADVNGGTEGMCALKTDGSLWCWGVWAEATTDFPALASASTPVQVDAGPWDHLSIGGNHGCVLDDSGNLGCFGHNEWGQLATTPADRFQSTVQTVGADTWSDVAAGYRATCGIHADDRSLWCWGYGRFGQVGLDPAVLLAGPGYAVETPNSIAHPSGGTWADVTAGQDHFCALDTDGAAWCWGENTRGNLGDGTTTESYVPVRAGTQTFVELQGARDRTCAVDGAGGLWCWGENGNNGLGDGTEVDAWSPVQILDDASGGLGHGSYTSYAIDGSGDLWCWGQPYQAGTGPGPDRVHNRGPAVAQVSSGDSHTCFIAADDQSLWCMGYNGNAQLGTPFVTVSDASSRPVSDGNDVPQAAVYPEQILPGPVLDVAAGLYFTCALDSDGHLWCWGDGDFGQLGNGGGDALAPVENSTYSWTDIVAGDDHVCGIRDGGRIACWGHPDALGQGIDTLLGSASDGRTWVKLEAGDGFTCGLDSDGEILCWGENSKGELGTGTTTDTTYEQALLDDAFMEPGPYKDLSSGDTHSCAVKEDGTQWCWPWTSADLVSQVMPGNDWETVEISHSAFRVCGTKTDTTAWCWGSVEYMPYELGIMGADLEAWFPGGTYDYYDTPVQVPGTGYSSLSAEYTHTCATTAGYDWVDCSAL